MYLKILHSIPSFLSKSLDPTTHIVPRIVLYLVLVASTLLVMSTCYGASGPLLFNARYSFRCSASAQHRANLWAGALCVSYGALLILGGCGVVVMEEVVFVLGPSVSGVLLLVAAMWIKVEGSSDVEEKRGKGGSGRKMVK